MLNGWKTMIGLAVAFVGQALSMAGIDMGADPQAVTDMLTVTIDNFITLAGIAFAVYGRIVAKRKVLTDQELK